MRPDSFILPFFIKISDEKYFGSNKLENMLQKEHNTYVNRWEEIMMPTMSG